MTNYERIKSMSVGQMKKLLPSDECERCFYTPDACMVHSDMDCAKGMQKWLDAEAEPTRWEKWIDDIKIEVPKRGARWQGMRSVARNTQRPTK